MKLILSQRNREVEKKEESKHKQYNLFLYFPNVIEVNLTVKWHTSSISHQNNNIRHLYVAVNGAGMSNVITLRFECSSSLISTSII